MKSKTKSKVVPFELFFKKVNIKPKNLSLYEMAFTHKSYNFDAGTSHKDYERLEFMGDSIVGFVVADLCFTLHPELSQGDMTKLRSSLVQAAALKKLAVKYHMNKYVKVGKSLQNIDILDMPHLLEDIFEAVMGAIYLDQGLTVAYGVIKNIFYGNVKTFSIKDDFHDYKSKLQEETQSETRNALEYKIVNENGPAHSRIFEIEVVLNGIVLGKGSGKSKKDAEQMAAKDALSKKA